MMSDECKDFIAKLLDKNPNSRLGSHGDVDELLAHPWFSKAKPAIRPNCQAHTEFLKTCEDCQEVQESYVDMIKKKTI